MTQLLTDNEILTVVHNIDCGEVRPFDIEFARAIEAAVLERAFEMAAVKCEYLPVGCGLE